MDVYSYRHENSMDCLDPLCGISYKGGPRVLLHSSQVPNIASTMADEIFITHKTIGLGTTELTSIITNALNTTLPSQSDTEPEPDSETEDPPNVGWAPEGLGQWKGFNTCVAIGQFDEEGYPGMIDRPGDWADEEWIIPYGDEIEVRRVREGHWRAFDTMVVDDPSVEGGELEIYAESHITGGNIWAHEGCYKYLEAWLDPSLLQPRIRSSHSSLGFSLPGELYELVISRNKARTSKSSLFYFLSQHRYSLC
jgi:hypothetical protein